MYTYYVYIYIDLLPSGFSVELNKEYTIFCKKKLLLLRSLHEEVCMKKYASKSLEFSMEGKVKNRSSVVRSVGSTYF
jgi:hypothetical protein